MVFNTFKPPVRTGVKIGIFPIPIAHWSGVGIFKQKRENPVDIGMAGQSALPIHKNVRYSVYYKEDIKQVFQNKPKLEILLICTPELCTVFTRHFASNTEGREVHDLQMHFWKVLAR